MIEYETDLETFIHDRVVLGDNIFVGNSALLLSEVTVGNDTVISTETWLGADLHPTHHLNEG